MASGNAIGIGAVLIVVRFGGGRSVSKFVLFLLLPGLLFLFTTGDSSLRFAFFEGLSSGIKLSWPSGGVSTIDVSDLYRCSGI